ncbi:hypothetical protein CD191_06850 [Paenibacillus odorifer]|uniref:Uncharacterized protein n=1 Tax=Paenibacillus odorifer TaxID=189426 RepID=A0AAD0P256_9BACL|nr:hypothetical protein CD191_06850 [Paenibacillus odorifer]
MKKYYSLLIILFLLVISISQLSLVSADGVNQQKELIAPETQIISILEDSSLKVNLKNIIREGNFFI